MSTFQSSETQTEELKKRLFIFSLIPIFFFGLIIVTLFALQIIKGPSYERKAKTNREQFAILPAIRGIIFDRTGEIPLAYNRRSFEIYLVPQNLPRSQKQMKDIIRKLSVLLDIPEDEITSKINKKNRLNESVIIKTDVPFKNVVYLAEHNKDYPGVYWKSKPKRVYPYRDLFSHIIGYVGMINEKELQERLDKGYNLESIVGKSGIEKVYDLQLKGKDGFIRRIVDAKNQIVAEVIDRGAEPIPGNNIILTIDKRIQEIAAEALGERIGAVIVSKPSTGEILAMVSHPGYDPNLFISQNGAEAFKRLALDKRKPFLNRAVQALYPPGSIFKLVVATAALETEKVPRSREFVCGGGYRLGNRFFSCWSNHGIVDMYKGIAMSCDSYFYQVALILGPDIIAQYARKMALGRLTGIDLPGEVAGLIPDPEWKIKMKKDIWYEGDTLNMAIGQGYVLTTPLQINTLTNLIANKGVVYKPHILKEIISAESGKLVYRKRPEILVRTDFKADTYDFIRNAMRGVVVEGTAKWGGAVLSVEMAGKTSSAEVLGRDTHSWFTAIAPYNAENPDEMITVTAIVEHGGAGSESAAPIVSEIVESIFGNCDLETARRNIWKKRTMIRAEKIASEGEEDGT